MPVKAYLNTSSTNVAQTAKDLLVPGDLKSQTPIYTTGPSNSGSVLEYNGIGPVECPIRIYDCGPFYIVKWFTATGSYQLQTKNINWDVAHLMTDAYWPFEYGSVGIEINSSEFRVLKLYAKPAAVGIYSDSGDWSKPKTNQLYIPSLIIPKGNTNESPPTNLYQDAYLRTNSTSSTMVKQTLALAGQFKHRSNGLSVSLMGPANKSENNDRYYLWTYGDYGVLSFSGLNIGNVKGQVSKGNYIEVLKLVGASGVDPYIPYGSGIFHLDYDHTSGRSMMVGADWSTTTSGSILRVYLGNDQSSSTNLFTNARLIGQIFFYFYRDDPSKINGAKSNIIGMNLHKSASDTAFERKVVLTNTAFKRPYKIDGAVSGWGSYYRLYTPFAVITGFGGATGAAKGSNLQQDGSDNFKPIDLPSLDNGNPVWDYSTTSSYWSTCILGLQNYDWRNDMGCRSWLTPMAVKSSAYRSSISQDYTYGCEGRFWRGRGFDSGAKLFGCEVMPNSQSTAVV